MFRTYEGVNSKGLTLSELIITLVLVFLLVGALGLIFFTGFKPFYSHQSRIGIKTEAANAFAIMSQELRQATSLTGAQSTSVTITADTDDNGADETIQYSWNGTSGSPLQRTDTQTMNVVSSVSSVTFSYYDSSYNLLSSPVVAANVRVVTVNLTAVSGDETFQLRSQTRLRNLS